MEEFAHPSGEHVLLEKRKGAGWGCGGSGVGSSSQAVPCSTQQISSPGELLLDFHVVHLVVHLGTVVGGAKLQLAGGVNC